jgi:dihydroorotase
MATVNPARVINRLPKLGTLQVGAPSDVAIMELVEGPVSFVDTATIRAPACSICSQCGL